MSAPDNLPCNYVIFNVRIVAAYLHQCVRLIKVSLTKYPIFDKTGKKVIRDMFLRREAPKKEDSKRYDTFGINLDKNKEFWECFGNKWVERCKIQFTNDRYIMFIGGVICTNKDNNTQGIWNTEREFKLNLNSVNDSIHNLIKDYIQI